MTAETLPNRHYAEGNVPSWKQLNYAVKLLCELAGVEVPTGKAEMRPWIAELKAMQDSKQGGSDGIPF